VEISQSVSTILFSAASLSIIGNTFIVIGVNPERLGVVTRQILKWVRVREGKEWEWEGKTPQVSKQIDATV
jgi:hypothetical protein